MRTLGIVYEDIESTFEQLLIKDKSFCIIYQNIHTLMIEIYETLNNIIDNSENFFVRNNNNAILRSQPDLHILSVKNVLKENFFSFLSISFKEINFSSTLW